MRIKILFASLIVLPLATLAAAQTKISGTAQCGKSDQEHALEVGDHPHHSFVIAQGKCTWTKPLEIAGIQSKEDIGTSFDEVRGNTSRGHGYVLNTWTNGDKSYVRIHGTLALKDGVPQSAEGNWSFTGGTGKLKGLKGKGTYKGTAGSDGSMTYEVEGEYELPK